MSEAPTYRYCVLGLAHTEKAAEIMMQAMIDSPSYVELLRGTASSRKPKLVWIFERNIRIVLQKSPSALRGIVQSPLSSSSSETDTNNQKFSEDGVPLANDDDEIIATFMLTDSAIKLSVSDYISAGILKMPFHTGMSSFFRLLQLLPKIDPIEQYKADHSNASSNESVLLLERMSVAPNHQRKGFGSMCMKAIVEDVRRLGKTLVLVTQSEGNVKFYSNFGLDVWHTMMYKPNDQFAYNNWFMKLIPSN